MGLGGAILRAGEFYRLGSQFLRAVVRVIEDTGPEQRIAVRTLAGEERTHVPVHQPFGFSSHAPKDGAVTHVIQNAGDPADLVALMPSNPAAARMGGLREGESVLYDAAGQRLHFQNGRVVAIDATEGMVINQKGKPLLTLSEDGHVFHGDLYVTGNVYANGDVQGANVSLSEHGHDGVKKGEEKTEKPGKGGKSPEPPKPPMPEPPRPPWRNPDGSFVGEQGDKFMIRIMRASSDPEGQAQQFIRDTDDYMAEIGERPLGDRPKKTASGGHFTIRAYSDGTFLSLRDGAASSGETPSGWWSLDISRNPDIIGSNGKMPLKLKFPD